MYCIIHKVDLIPICHRSASIPNYNYHTVGTTAAAEPYVHLLPLSYYPNTSQAQLRILYTCGFVGAGEFVQKIVGGPPGNFVKKAWMVCNMILAIRGQLQKLDNKVHQKCVKRFGGCKDCTNSRTDDDMKVLCAEITVIIFIIQITCHQPWNVPWCCSPLASMWQQNNLVSCPVLLCHWGDCTGNTHCNDKYHQCGISPANCPYNQVPWWWLHTHFPTTILPSSHQHHCLHSNCKPIFNMPVKKFRFGISWG